MSLQSTYQSRKALLVNNLETMGVTGYSSDDGLTTLIEAILEIAPTPQTYDGISITADTIVEKGDTLTLTSQLTLGGIPVTVPNISIDWYEDGTLFDSILTDNNGQTTYTYSATGTGDIPIKAQTDSLANTINIRDVLYYALESRIKSEWTKKTDVSGRNIYLKPIYSSPYNINSSTSYTIEFKFSTISNYYGLSSVFGIGLTDDTYNIEAGILVQNGALKSYYSTGVNNRNKEGTSSPTTTTSNIFKIVHNGSSGTTTWYCDDVQFAQYTTESTNKSTLRYDLFSSNSSILEYIIIEYGT